MTQAPETVKRYDWAEDGEMPYNVVGEFVKYDDYAAIEDQLVAANARADGYAEGVRDAANALKTEYRISSFWLNGVEVFGAEAATPAACYQTILALRDKPAPAVTVQETAIIEATDYARNRLEMMASDTWNHDARDFKRALKGIFVEYDTALRAIAGGGDE